MTVRSILALFLLSLSLFTSAEFVGPGSASDHITQAAQVKDAKDDMPVRLEGYLVEKIGPEKYHFKDASGMVEVEIDAEDFNGETVTPEMRIQIIGEVDKDGRKRSVDADLIKVLP